MSEAPAVARCFVALPVPRPIRQSLAILRPPAGKGVRPVPIENLHVTVHFLGSVEIETAKSALHKIDSPSFSVRFDRFGEFSLRGGRRILMIGVAAVAGLSELHARTAKALAELGFEAERRPYRPHITLARLAAGADHSVAECFNAQALPKVPIEYRCTRFALYASETTPEGARYSLLESFSLAAEAS